MVPLESILHQGRKCGLMDQPNGDSMAFRGFRAGGELWRLLEGFSAQGSVISALARSGLTPEGYGLKLPHTVPDSPQVRGAPLLTLQHIIYALRLNRSATQVEAPSSTINFA